MFAKSRHRVARFDLSIGYTVIGYGSGTIRSFPASRSSRHSYGEVGRYDLANDRFEQFRMGLKRHAF